MTVRYLNVGSDTWTVIDMTGPAFSRPGVQFHLNKGLFATMTVGPGVQEVYELSNGLTPDQATRDLLAHVYQHAS